MLEVVDEYQGSREMIRKHPFYPAIQNTLTVTVTDPLQMATEISDGHKGAISSVEASECRC